MHIKESMCRSNNGRREEALWTDRWTVDSIAVHFVDTSLRHKILLKLGVILGRLINNKIKKQNTNINGNANLNLHTNILKTGTVLFNDIITNLVQ